MYSGASFVLVLTPRSKEFKKKSIFYLVSIMIMYSVLIRGAQGDHYKRGEEYYTQGRYQKALQEFKKETQTWYLRLDYNHNESGAMLLMAETYCQLADFDKARETYKLILRRRYQYYQRKRAGTGLGRLELGLKIAAKYEAWVSGEADFLYDLAEEEFEKFSRPELTKAYILYDIASAYQYDLNCYAKSLEVYRKILDMDIPESTKERARKNIYKLTESIRK
jgi:tetratricopeptide (TPR) repeat protein